MWNLDKYNNNIALITEAGEKISYTLLSTYCKTLTDNIKERCLVFNLCTD